MVGTRNRRSWGESNLASGGVWWELGTGGVGEEGEAFELRSDGKLQGGKAGIHCGERAMSAWMNGGPASVVGAWG